MKNRLSKFMVFVFVVILGLTSFAQGINSLEKDSIPLMYSKLENAIVCYIGSGQAYVNNKWIDIDEKDSSITPIIIDEIKFVPLRFIAESLEATLRWDSTSKSISIKLGDDEVELNINENIVEINGIKNKMQDSIKVINSTTYISLEAVSEIFNKRVFYDRDLIIISNNRVIFSKEEDADIIDILIKKITTKDTSLIEASNREVLKNQNSIVDIISENREGMVIAGKGFFIDEGLFATSYSLVKDMKKAYIQTTENKTYEIDGIATKDSILDIAIVKTKDSVELDPIVFTSYEPKESAGKKIYTFMNHEELEKVLLTGKIIQVSTLEPSISKMNLLHTSYNNIPEDSLGSPIFDENGKVVGIITLAYTHENSIVLSSNHAKDLIRELENKESYTKQVSLNGDLIKFEKNPVIYENDILVPVHTIFDKLGLELDYNSETGHIVGTRYDSKLNIDDLVIEIEGNGKVTVVNGERDYKMEKVSRIIEGTPYISLEFITISIGAKLDTSLSKGKIDIINNNLENTNTRLNILKSSINKIDKTYKDVGIEIIKKGEINTITFQEDNIVSNIEENICGISDTWDGSEKSFATKELRITENGKEYKHNYTITQFKNDLSILMGSNDKINIYQYDLNYKDHQGEVDYINKALQLGADKKTQKEINQIMDYVNLFKAEKTNVISLDNGNIKYIQKLNKQDILESYMDTILSSLAYYDEIDYTLSAVIDNKGRLESVKIDNLSTNYTTNKTMNIKSIVIKEDIELNYDIDSLAPNKSITEFNKKYTRRMFPDPALEDAIIEELYSARKLENITSVEYYDEVITDLEGIQNLKNVEMIEFGYLDISDLSPLQGLTQLKVLDLSGSNIKNINSLSKLTNLEKLYLGHNEIEDISPLLNMMKLEWLHIYGNNINNIKPLSNLKNLSVLWASGNEIKDISPLNKLSNLQVLTLGYNEIENIAPLRSLVNLEYLVLNNNKIKNLSPLENLKNIDELYLYDNEIENIEALAKMTKLKILELNNNIIKDIDILKNLSNLEQLEINNNVISDISSLKSLIKLENLTLNDNNIEDISSIKDLSNLSNLHLSNNKIKSISSIAELFNLEELELGNNQIENISYLKDIKKVKKLHINDNNIIDISTIGKLTNLQDLNLNNNKIQNINGVVGLENLKSLYLNNNNIKNIIPIKDLINLQKLEVSNNEIEDLTPLKDIIGLKSLCMNNNNIQEIETLKFLTNLENVELNNNYVKDITALKNIFGLKELDFSENQIVNLQALENLFKLEKINLANNTISDISPLKGLNKLEYLNIKNNKIDVQDMKWLEDIELVE